MSKFQSYLRKTQKLNLDVYKKSIRSLSHNVLYPCDLGIIFFNNGSHSLFEELKLEIKTIFDSYFYEIKKIIMENSLLFSEAKENRVRLRKAPKEVFLYPTNPFYDKISELKIRNDFNIGVGITDLPIYSSNDKNLIFLYGEAHLDRNCAIVSKYNLKYEFISLQHYNDTLQRRIIKEVIHEVGHIILGPKHCGNKLCVMSFSTNLGDIDKKALYFCNECRCELERIKDSLDF
jgi:predicted Zn-dependent protease